MVTAPAGLGERGSALWEQVTAGREFNAAQLALVVEACRTADRLDKLDQLVRGDVEAWCRLVAPDDDRVRVLVVNSALGEARQQANLLRQIVATLGLSKGDDKPAEQEDELERLRRARAGA